jgi:hypothetical protein
MSDPETPTHCRDTEHQLAEQQQETERTLEVPAVEVMLKWGGQ